MITGIPFRLYGGEANSLFGSSMMAYFKAYLFGNPPGESITSSMNSVMLKSICFTISPRNFVFTSSMFLKLRILYVLCNIVFGLFCFWILLLLDNFITRPAHQVPICDFLDMFKNVRFRKLKVKGLKHLFSSQTFSCKDPIVISQAINVNLESNKGVASFNSLDDQKQLIVETVLQQRTNKINAWRDHFVFGGFCFCFVSSTTGRIRTCKKWFRTYNFLIC